MLKMNSVNMYYWRFSI